MKAKPIGASGRVVTTRDGYDRWAKVYESDGNPLTAMEEPVVAELVGDPTGLALLDLGCGTGRHALAFAARSARVTAVDFSGGMLDVARAKPGAEAVQFVEHDLTGTLPFEPRSFDRVLSCLVLEHLDDLATHFGEIRRVLRDDGVAVVTAMHPAMMLLGVQAGFRDVDSGEKIHPKSHDNQLSDFVMAALGAGLRPSHLLEGAVDEALAARFPRAEKYLGWMMLFAMRLVPGS
jgi:ubiquinone/menaquinone biosynthesis C-methylase UbiE